jgi:hypothetical protein
MPVYERHIAVSVVRNCNVCLFKLDDIKCSEAGGGKILTFLRLAVIVPGYSPRRPAFDSKRYQIFSVVADLGRDPLSHMRISEELLARKRSGSGLENRD